MKQGYKDLINKRLKSLDELSPAEIEFLGNLYQHYIVRKEISTSNKIINQIFNQQKSDKHDMKSLYNSFNEYFYGSSLRDLLYTEPQYISNDPDEDFSDCNTFSRPNEDSEYLSSLSDQEFEDLIKESCDNSLRQAALILYCGRSNERIVDRAPLELKIAYANMQSYFINLYKTEKENKRRIDVFGLMREAGALARNQQCYNGSSFKYAIGNNHPYEDYVYEESVDFTKTPITILNLFELYLRQEANKIKNLANLDLVTATKKIKNEYLLTNEQKSLFDRLYKKEITPENLGYLVFSRALDCSNEISRIRQRNKGIGIKFSEDDKEYGDEE